MLPPLLFLIISFIGGSVGYQVRVDQEKSCHEVKHHYVVPEAPAVPEDPHQ